MPRGNRPPFPYDCMVDGAGLMLSQRPGAEIAWRERKLDFFAPRVSQTDQSYAQFPPEDETTWAVDDLSGGYGQRVAPRGGSTGYAHGVADTRIPHQVTLPPEVLTTPISSSGTITDHFELGATSLRAGGVGRVPIPGRLELDPGEGVRTWRHGSFGGGLQGARGPADGFRGRGRHRGRRALLGL